MDPLIKKYKSLIVRHLAGEASPDDEKELQSWLDAGADNKALYEEFYNIWQYTPKNTSDVVIGSEMAWDIINRGIEAEEQQMKLRSKFRPLTVLYAISGMAAVILIALGLWLYIDGTSNNEMIGHEVAGSDIEMLTLPDQSAIYMNPGAKIQYPEKFSGKQRTVKLSGDAFFEVSINKDQPFIIEMENTAIKVLGTSFYIDNNAINGVEVSVVSGSVLFYSLNPDIGMEVVLEKGEKGIFDLLAGSMVKEQLQSFNFMAWKTGVLVFDQAPLQQVMDDILKTYGLQMDDGSNLPDLKLTARFDNEKPDDIFRTIGMLYGLEIELTQNTVTIKQSGF
jgi:ferric-dicitrate binding protein FerR (iron transport regulator)